MVWWEAVLSPALQVLFDKLSSGEITELLHRSNINEFLLEKLKITYYTNLAVLDDAEEKQYDNPAIETWLDMLKETTYEAEDILDVLATEALRSKLQASSQSMRNQVCNWNLVSPFNSLDDKIKSKITEIVDKLEYIAKQKDLLGLKGEGGRKFRITRRMPTTPLFVESCVFGRDDDKEEIIRLLLENDCESQASAFSVVPLLGMGGIGKTMLAQFVFNDRRVNEFFDVKAWACVSDQFDMVRVTKAILESATCNSWETMNLELLQNSLGKKLSKKKFLVVLDDLWDENYENWHELMLPLVAGAPGSKIMVTTRNEAALSFMNACRPYRLRELSDQACWSLFSRHAFPKADLGTHHQLEAIGREIVKKCRGVPLAAKSLGSLLGSKLGIDHWQEILNSNIWDLPTRRNGILPALQLSYHHLPANLKRCFAYCSLFPKDYEFDKDKLVLLWMAEGFIQQGEDNKRMEDLGAEYFNDLLSRSFFQESPVDKSRYIMHDLMNDLAQLVSRKMRLSFDGRSGLQKPTGFLGKARHFSYPRGRYDVYKKFESLIEAEWLRTFLPLSPREIGFCYLSNKVVADLLPRLRCLRVLSLRGYCITELPDLIGDLKSLRYLNLSHTAIKSLPQSVCTLYNLQTLMLNDCDSLEELPTGLTDLINLHYFDISGSRIPCMPLHMSRLRNLRTLPEFVVDPKSGSGIGELRDMVHLHGALTLSRLENIEDAWDTRKANLTSKKHLTTLTMEWSSNFELQDENVQITVLEMLQPHSKVKKVNIRRYGGARFSFWLGDPSFSNMVFLSLTDCRRCMFLPPLGQLASLKHLRIKGLTAVKSVDVEFYGYALSHGKPFPSLEILSFEDMLEWEDWSCSSDDKRIEAFPSLRELYIERCQNLRGKLPNHLPCLEKLVINECKRWASRLPRLPLLNQLHIRGCDASSLGTALDMSSLVSLQISEISNFPHLNPGLMPHLTQLKHLSITECADLNYLCEDDGGFQQLTSLRSMVIRYCPQLIALTKKEHYLPMAIEYLEFEHCHSLQTLPAELCSLTSLQELMIKDCPAILSFTETNVPSMLTGLTIRGCNLESLPKGMIYNRHTPLEYLYISGCYSLTSFPSMSEPIPTSFRQLSIDLCPDLESLPDGIMLRDNVFLKVLEIFDCSALISFPSGQLPLTLKTLTICSCSNLESVANILSQDGEMVLESFRVGNCTSLKSLPDGLHKLAFLDYLEIERCPSLTSFPEGGLPMANLKRVHVMNCENLRTLPEQMQYLTALQELCISDCPGIESFPDGGLPINLVSLEVKDCESISPLTNWGLHRLNSLEKLSVTGGCSTFSAFPEWMLPPTLTSLHLGRLPNLEFRTDWLQNLTCLEDLRLKDCRKLHSLPIDGLPATLSRLEVSGCPLVEQQCEREWTKIDHIPCILM